MQTKHVLTERLASLQSWRYGVSAQIARIREFLQVQGYYSAENEAAFKVLDASVRSAAITIIFVAEAGRGKSELINALFFADLGVRLLPSGTLHATRCITEVRFDQSRKTGMRLLPIESREAPRRFQDIYNDESAWAFIAFDADNPDSIARAFSALTKTRHVSVADALSWGLHQDPAVKLNQTGGSVEVPCWRYASINFPHPLLDAGLVIIDTPGLSALTVEPEFTRENIPAADAIIVVLDAAEGVTKRDMAIWKDALGGARNLRDRERVESTQARLVAINKVDLLHVENILDPKDADRAWLREVDKRVQDVADLMRVEPIKVLPVSATQALIGKFEGNQDALLKSRLYRLERALSLYLPENRQDSLGKDILSTLSSALEGIQATIDQSRYQALESLRALSDLRRKNLLLTEALDAGAGSKQSLLFAALEELRVIKPIHNALSKELSDLTNPELAKTDAQKTQRQIADSMLPGRTGEALATYFANSRARIAALDAKLEDIRLIFGNLGEKTFRTLGLGRHEIHLFATHRFLTEIDKAEEKATTELSRSGHLLVRRSSTVAEQFISTIAPQIIRVLEIAHRESASWMRGIFTGIESPVSELGIRMKARTGKVDLIRSAELDLAEKIAEVQANIDVIKSKHATLAKVRDDFERFTGNRRNA